LIYVRWEANSCGYHGDDGLLYRGHGKGEAFGPTYTSGDVVGAGINYAAQEFFFTYTTLPLLSSFKAKLLLTCHFFPSSFCASKNGQVVGSVYKDMKGPLFPTIAVHSQNEEYVTCTATAFFTYFRLFEYANIVY